MILYNQRKTWNIYTFAIIFQNAWKFRVYIDFYLLFMQALLTVLYNPDKSSLS